MGCDIHPAIEQFVEDEWLLFARGDLGIPRWYSLFTAMANVRSGAADSPVPISEPRGVPEDCSLDIDDVENFLGDHSRSWLSPEEVEEAARRTLAANPGATKSGLEDVLAIMATLAARGVKSRLVFGFDS